ncbi:his Kinase A domain protein, partial [Vibrio parahaemolyticus EKP-021]
SVGRRSAAVSR